MARKVEENGRQTERCGGNQTTGIISHNPPDISTFGCQLKLTLWDLIFFFSQEVSDLQEQLADLMRHLETQQAISNAPVETRQVIFIS